jgi:hypothetical protein
VCASWCSSAVLRAEREREREGEGEGEVERERKREREREREMEQSVPCRLLVPCVRSRARRARRLHSTAPGPSPVHSRHECFARLQILSLPRCPLVGLMCGARRGGPSCAIGRASSGLESVPVRRAPCAHTSHLTRVTAHASRRPAPPRTRGAPPAPAPGRRDRTGPRPAVRGASFLDSSRRAGSRPGWVKSCRFSNSVVN